jgi:hypothetical protein
MEKSGHAFLFRYDSCNKYVYKETTMKKLGIICSMILLCSYIAQAQTVTTQGVVGGALAGNIGLVPGTTAYPLRLQGGKPFVLTTVSYVTEPDFMFVPVTVSLFDPKGKILTMDTAMYTLSVIAPKKTGVYTIVVSNPYGVVVSLAYRTN